MSKGAIPEMEEKATIFTWMVLEMTPRSKNYGKIRQKTKWGYHIVALSLQKKDRECAAHVNLRTTMRLMISAVTIRCDQSSNSNQAAQIRGVENKKFIFVRLQSCAGGVQMCQIECHYNKQQSHNW